ncbi:MAG TPA: sigma-70 family RNA polymerase sigma factor, partial [Gemmataceae bacterium]|nr:sigma-70 family RNA polymerase sigma factor [Gemmataceae bacterium]
MSKDTNSDAAKFNRHDYAFNTTHWSVVIAAGDVASTNAQAALEELCRTYWFPLYAYVRRGGRTPEEAQDLTQEFFLGLILKQSIRMADPARGKFRTFLLTCLKNFSNNESDKARAAKRGGGQAPFPLEFDDAEQRYLAEPASDLTPERLFDKRWAVAVVERAQARLREEYVAAKNLSLFDHLQEQVWGERSETYGELATRLNTTEVALRGAAHRMRNRFRTFLREEVAHT